MKWRHKKFTFMVIPDANSSVIRFQLSAVILVIGLVIVIALLAGALTAFLLYKGNTGQIGQLQQQLSAATGKYEKIINSKNEHIDVLQTNVADLSEQAKTMNDRMADIKNLESQLKKMVGIETGSSAKTKGTLDQSSKAVTADEEQISMDGGTGGEEVPITEGEMGLLVDQTRDDFLSIGQQIEWLKPELEITKDAVTKQLKRLRVTPTIWPTDSRRVTSLFGIRKDPFTHRATFHAGLDISGDTGDPIYAAADGTVISAERSSSHGNNVLISHANGVRTHYSHLSKILTEVGAKVSKGDIIGELGSTGRSTGPHLHYEVIINGENVDPRPYLNATRGSN
ncbi:M23 family metallopeptidase [Cohnella silvisoli]|uniref:M23 family metallopeptidase n=1 Tax=Cohnella silvisoli TaxID=2873699 RepID=A0ABV1L111_9BACL|nr:M23 family metallopeptidase [Cohnella silvisoli]MCD9024880.1 M23 family metallopeptidase [Cohnella silvisoli]